MRSLPIIAFGLSGLCWFAAATATDAPRPAQVDHRIDATLAADALAPRRKCGKVVTIIL